jgi:hypothetical protein
MGVDFLFLHHRFYDLEEIFDGSVSQYESLDTASDKVKDLLFRFPGTELVCNSKFGVAQG